MSNWIGQLPNAYTVNHPTMQDRWIIDRDFIGFNSVIRLNHINNCEILRFKATSTNSLKIHNGYLIYYSDSTTIRLQEPVSVGDYVIIDNHNIYVNGKYYKAFNYKVYNFYQVEYKNSGLELCYSTSINGIPRKIMDSFYGFAWHNDVQGTGSTHWHSWTASYNSIPVGVKQTSLNEMTIVMNANKDFSISDFYVRLHLDDSYFICNTSTHIIHSYRTTFYVTDAITNTIVYQTPVNGITNNLIKFSNGKLFVNDVDIGVTFGSTLVNDFKFFKCSIQETPFLRIPDMWYLKTNYNYDTNNNYDKSTFHYYKATQTFKYMITENSNFRFLNVDSTIDLANKEMDMSTPTGITNFKVKFGEWCVLENTASRRENNLQYLLINGKESPIPNNSSVSIPSTGLANNQYIYYADFGYKDLLTYKGTDLSTAKMTDKELSVDKCDITIDGFANYNNLKFTYQINGDIMNEDWFDARENIKVAGFRDKKGTVVLCDDSGNVFSVGRPDLLDF